MKKILFFLFSLPLILLAEPPTLNLIADYDLSPYVGAENLLTLHAGVEYGENWLVKKPVPPKTGWGPSFERLGELILLWQPYNYTTMVVQHEFFGHGYRGRSLKGVSVKGYKLEIPPPYGHGGGATNLRLYLNHVTPFELLAISSAGTEATWILANRLKLQWLQTGLINPTQTSLYGFAQHDLTSYIRHTEERWWIVPGISWDTGGDIHDYIDVLNATFPKGHLSLKRLKKLALINYAEPFTYYSIYAGGFYLFKGEKTPIPMIPIGSYGYLPGLRLNLAPFGPEYYLENFLAKDQNPIYFYLRGGAYAGLRSYGIGFEHAALWSLEGIPWGLRADVWLQPDLPYKASSKNNLIHFTPARHYKSRFGFSLSLIGHLKVSPKSALFFQLGGKTTGYLPGETLSPSVIARLGFSFF